MEQTEENTVVKEVMDSEDFFDTLESEVNSGIVDDIPLEATQEGDDSNSVTRQNVGSNSKEEVWESESNPYKKRYADSSREAVKRAEQMKDLEPFVPVLNAMKQDSGLVQHVRDYLTNGGVPAKTLKEKLNLDEDFMFDPEQAVSEPDSDSGKLMGAYVNEAVNQKVGRVLQDEKVRANQQREKLHRKKEEVEFKKRTGMSDTDFNEMVSKAQSYKLSLDDVNTLLNQDKARSNVRSEVKQDMLNQMKNVRDIPTSASGANNSTKGNNLDDGIFQSLLDVDGDLENMFG